MKNFFSNALSRLSIKEFLKYGTVGVLNTVVDFAVFWLLSSLADMSATPAQVISFLVATLNSFLFNRHWTFMKSGHTNRSEVLRYCLGKALYLLCNLILLNLFLPLIGALPFLSGLPESRTALIAKLPTAGILLFFNYFYDKLNVFR